MVDHLPYTEFFILKDSIKRNYAEIFYAKISIKNDILPNFYVKVFDIMPSYLCLFKNGKT